MVNLKKGVKDENKIKKDLAKNVFKKNGKTFEDDLKGFFEFITSRQMSFGASFYAKSKPTDSFLTLNVNNFFSVFQIFSLHSFVYCEDGFELTLCIKKTRFFRIKKHCLF